MEFGSEARWSVEKLDGSSGQLNQLLRLSANQIGSCLRHLNGGGERQVRLVVSGERWPSDGGDGAGDGWLNDLDRLSVIVALVNLLSIELVLVVGWYRLTDR